MQSKITGSGDIKEEHWITSGDKSVGVGVNVINATNYTYNFGLYDGGASSETGANAVESLQVGYAETINAFSEAQAVSKKDWARSEISIQKGSLENYLARAVVQDGILTSTQFFTKAAGDNVMIVQIGLCSDGDVRAVSCTENHVNNGALNRYLANTTVSIPSKKVFITNFVKDVSNADRISIKTLSLNSKGERSADNLILKEGSLLEYYNGLSNSINESTEGSCSYQRFSKASGHIEAGAIGLGSSENDKSSVITYIANSTLFGYHDIAQVNSKNISAAQWGSVDLNPRDGRFISSSIQKTSKQQNDLTKGSKFGTKYNILMLSFVDCANHSGTVNGVLGHFIDLNDPRFNKIQRAIDNAYSGDQIFVAPGVYNESLVINKSLSIFGSGIDGNNGTIVDNKGRDSVVKILGKSSKVTLSDLVIAGGHANKGGGIYNEGDLVVSGCKIHGNTANKGGGVYSSHNFTMLSGEITGNNVENNGYGGGIYNHIGSNVYLEGGRISNNTAGYGGGIYSDHAFIHLDGGEISYNHAAWEGGGICNDFTVLYGIHGNDSIVHHNTADVFTGDEWDVSGPSYTTQKPSDVDNNWLNGDNGNLIAIIVTTVFLVLSVICVSMASWNIWYNWVNNAAYGTTTNIHTIIALSFGLTVGAMAITILSILLGPIVGIVARLIDFFT